MVSGRVEAKEGGSLGREEERGEKGVGLRDRGSEAQREVELEQEREEAERDGYWDDCVCAATAQI